MPPSERPTENADDPFTLEIAGGEAPGDAENTSEQSERDRRERSASEKIASRYASGIVPVLLEHRKNPMIEMDPLPTSPVRLF